MEIVALLLPLLLWGIIVSVCGITLVSLLDDAWESKREESKNRRYIEVHSDTKKSSSSKHNSSKFDDIELNKIKSMMFYDIDTGKVIAELKDIKDVDIQ